MANDHMTRSSTALVISEIHIKTTETCYSIHTGTAIEIIIKKYNECERWWKGFKIVQHFK
jgi:hypothetical protein